MRFLSINQHSAPQNQKMCEGRRKRRRRRRFHAAAHPSGSNPAQVISQELAFNFKTSNFIMVTYSIFTVDQFGPGGNASGRGFWLERKRSGTHRAAYRVQGDDRGGMTGGLRSVWKLRLSASTSPERVISAAICGCVKLHTRQAGSPSK